MCLGVPGQVRALDDSDPLAKVEVAGATRTVNIALVRDEGIEVGDWVLIHLGFAMEIIDKEKADLAMEGLHMMGPGTGPASA